MGNCFVRAARLKYYGKMCNMKNVQVKVLNRQSISGHVELSLSQMGVLNSVIALGRETSLYLCVWQRS